MSERQRRVAAEDARARFTKYPRWIDTEGVSRPLSSHPNYAPCRGILRFNERQSEAEGIPVVEAWRSIEAFVYGVEKAIGLRPSEYDRLGSLVPGYPLMFGNVTWYRREPDTRRARYARLRAADPVAQGGDAVLPEGRRPTGRSRIVGDEQLSPGHPGCICWPSCKPTGCRWTDLPRVSPAAVRSFVTDARRSYETGSRERGWSGTRP